MFEIRRTTLACGSTIRAHSLLSYEPRTFAEWIGLCRSHGECGGLTEAQLEEMFDLTDRSIETGLVKSRQLMLSLMQTNSGQNVACIYYSAHFHPRQWTVHPKELSDAGMMTPSCVLIAERK